MKLKIIVRKVEENLYVASCRGLKGCHIQAESEQQAHTMIKAAINAYLTSHKQRHEKIPYNPED